MKPVWQDMWMSMDVWLSLDARLNINGYQNWYKPLSKLTCNHLSWHTGFIWIRWISLARWMQMCYRTHVIELIFDARVNESWRTCEYVMAHVWTCHGRNVRSSSYSRVIILASHGTYGLVMAHIWMRHGARMNESLHICERIMAHIYASHGTYEFVTVHV